MNKQDRENEMVDGYYESFGSYRVQVFLSDIARGLDVDNFIADYLCDNGENEELYEKIMNKSIDQLFVMMEKAGLYEQFNSLYIDTIMQYAKEENAWWNN